MSGILKVYRGVLSQSKDECYNPIMSTDLKNSRWALMGASRGLGAAFTQTLLKQGVPSTEIWTFSRRPGQAQIQWVQSDFSQHSSQEAALDRLRHIRPTHVIYFAAGGPYGPFGKSHWKNHLWAFEVTFLFPTRLLHFLLENSDLQDAGTTLVGFVGSSIAEDGDDPGAASYAAAKAGLKAVVGSVARENPENLDIRWYSPGYMNTSLLPKGAKPRQYETQLWQPNEVADDLLKFLVDGARHSRRRLTPYRM